MSGVLYSLQIQEGDQEQNRRFEGGMAPNDLLSAARSTDVAMRGMVS